MRRRLSAALVQAAIGKRRVYSYLSNHDQGSGAIDAETGRITPVAHWSSKWAWWSFRHSKLGGTTPTYLIAKAAHYNAAANMHLALWAQAADTDDWTAFTTQTIGATDISIQHGSAFPAGPVYISALPMYPFSRTQRKMAEWMAHAHTSDTASGTDGVIGYATARDAGDGSGRTCPALPFYGFKLTNATANTKNKCILTAGNHPSETPGLYQLEAAVDWLLGGSPEAEALLDWFEFYIYPCLNPQGVWAGYFRSSPETPTQDNNRLWDGTGVNEAVDAFKAAMTADTGGAIEVGIDFHSYMDASTVKCSVNDPAAALTAAFITKMTALDATYTAQTETTASTLKNVWLAAYSAKLALTQEQGGAIARSVANWKTYGAQTMQALATMQTENLFTNHAAEEDPVGSRDFNGTTDRIDWPNPANLAGSALTVSEWAYIDTLTAYDHFMVIHQAGDAAAGITLSNVNGTNLTLQLLRTGATSKYKAAGLASPYTGAWIHLLATDNGTFTSAAGITLYLNGADIGGAATQNGVTEAAPAGSLSLGGRKFDDVRNIDGKLAQVGVWNRVLTAGEIANLAAGQAPSLAAPSGLVYYFKGNTDSLANEIGGALGTADGTTQLTGVGNGPSIIYG